MIGYIIEFAHIKLVDIRPGSAVRAGNMVYSGEITKPRLHTLTSGEKINFDRDLRSPIVPGQIAQKLVCYSGGKTLYDLLESTWQGKYESVKFHDIGGQKHCAPGILLSVVDITAIPISNRGYMVFVATFEMMSLWTNCS